MQMMGPEPRGVLGFRAIGIHDGPRTGDNLLLQEITRRFTDELASTIGFVAQTAAQSRNEEVKVALAGVIQHIHEFATVNRALQMPADDRLVDASTYLRDLCQSISQAWLQYRNVELLFRQSSVKLRAKRCWRVGMVVSELISNASRHAFEGDCGRIRVELSSRGPLAICAVSDNGSARANVPPGQGSKIVRALAGDLNGSVDYRFGTRGTVVTLSFPFVATEPDGIDPVRLGLSPTGPS